ncbi:MAG: amino acid decarboxylase [Pyrinomonadaceae bacterium]|nr:amino acid decarboxylase [Pyrinomonadaceae bacterium]
MKETEDNGTCVEELGDLPPDEFRRHLHAVADWIADYREGIASRRVSPDAEPGAVANTLPHAPPEHSESLDTIIADFDRVIVPNLVHWGHPQFLGYFGSTTNAPGILGEMLAAALNVSAMTWRTSPAATELESVVLSWLRQMLGLPANLKGIVYDTASVAILHALAAAREAINLDVRKNGLAGRSEVPTMRIYTSDQAHSSIEKAAIMLGIGEENVRRVESDDDFRLSVEALRAAINKDLQNGYRPLAVVATVGTTSATSVDPVPEIAALCHEYDLWLHVDAAYGGALALLPEGRWAMMGVEAADSVVVNPHKWLFVPLDFSALYTKHPELLRRTFALTPEYLRGDASAHEENYMDYGIQLGRRFRALKAWMVFRAFGREGLIARIREHCRLARTFASWVDGENDFQLLAPVTMGVVCFQALPNVEQEFPPAIINKFNVTLVERINRTGKAYLTRTELRGQTVARLAIGNVLTTEEHLKEVWTLIKSEAELLRAEDLQAL